MSPSVEHLTPRRASRSVQRSGSARPHGSGMAPDSSETCEAGPEEQHLGWAGLWQVLTAHPPPATP